MKTLDELRNEIDVLDRTLRDTLTSRMQVSQGVAQNKMQTGLPIYRPEREADICKKFSENISDPNVRTYATAAYRALLRTSREYQYYYQMTHDVECTISSQLRNASKAAPDIETVCFQGIDGSWSSLAAQQMYPNAKRTCVPTFAGVFDAISDATAQAGILPLDNSTAGTVNDVYDLLIKNDYYIVKATPIHIHNCLMALPGAAIESIRTVHSHPQALSQCAEHVKAIGAIPVPETNTAVAAKAITQSGDITAAAIGSPKAAHEYGLVILDENFNDIPYNQTRFLSISRTLCAPKDANRISLAFCAPNESGALANILAIFADNGLNLTKIMSRPSAEKAWEYIFYLDCQADINNPSLYAVLYHLNSELPWIKLLGCYHEDELPNRKG